MIRILTGLTSKAAVMLMMNLLACISSPCYSECIKGRGTLDPKKVDVDEDNINNSDADDEPSSLQLFASHHLQLDLSQLPPQPEEEEEMILGAFKNF